MIFDSGTTKFVSKYSGSVLHVYADRDNRTGLRAVCMVGTHSAYVCEMTGNPADLNEFKVTDSTRPITRDEANWLLSALHRAENDPKMGFSPGEDVRKLSRRVRDATFMVRFQSDVSVIKREPKTVDPATRRETLKGYVKAVEALIKEADKEGFDFESTPCCCGGGLKITDRQIKLDDGEFVEGVL